MCEQSEFMKSLNIPENCHISTLTSISCTGGSEKSDYNAGLECKSLNGGIYYSGVQICNPKAALGCRSYFQALQFEFLRNSLDFAFKKLKEALNEQKEALNQMANGETGKAFYEAVVQAVETASSGLERAQQAFEAAFESNSP